MIRLTRTQRLVLIWAVAAFVLLAFIYPYARRKGWVPQISVLDTVSSKLRVWELVRIRA